MTRNRLPARGDVHGPNPGITVKGAGSIARAVLARRCAKTVEPSDQVARYTDPFHATVGYASRRLRDLREWWVPV